VGRSTNWEGIHFPLDNESEAYYTCTGTKEGKRVSARETMDRPPCPATQQLRQHGRNLAKFPGRASWNPPFTAHSGEKAKEGAKNKGSLVEITKRTQISLYESTD
jgi:hypothetical protein